MIPIMAESTEDLSIPPTAESNRKSSSFHCSSLVILLPPANLLYNISAGTSSQRGVIGLNLLGLRAPRSNVGQFELVYRRQVKARFVFSICSAIRENPIGIRASFDGCSQDLRDGTSSLALRLVSTGVTESYSRGGRWRSRHLDLGGCPLPCGLLRQRASGGGGNVCVLPRALRRKQHNQQGH